MSGALNILLAPTAGGPSPDLAASVPDTLWTYVGIFYAVLTCTASGGLAPYGYAWSVLTGDAVLLSAIGPTTGITSDTGITATLECVVTDANGATVTASCTVTV